MEALLATEAQSAGFTEQLVEFWMGRCDDFLRWQMEEVIKKAPSDHTLAWHRQNLRAILHAGRLLYAEIADPESPLNRLALEFPGKIGQLEKSWELIHNRMPDQEADKLLGEVFPDEPGPRKAA